MPEYTPPPGSGGGGGGGGSITLDEADNDNGNEITIAGTTTPVKISGNTAPLLLIEGNSSTAAQVQLRSNSLKHFLEAESSGLLFLYWSEKPDTSGRCYFSWCRRRRDYYWSVRR